MIKLLEKLPMNNMGAQWQVQQLRNWVQNLPQNHFVTIHDFSENYRCRERNEIQSNYFQKTEVSIRVTILHRHAILELDGLESTTEKLEIVTEHFYVIYPDDKHDQHFTHYCQKLISDYLKSIS